MSTQTLDNRKRLNYPWLIYSYTLNTPSQMQRECNVVAFGELILSTRLNKKRKWYIQSPKWKDVIKACNSWTCVILIPCHEWKRVNCVILIERPFGLYIELQEDTPNPRLEGYDYNTLILPLTVGISLAWTSMVRKELLIYQDI